MDREAVEKEYGEVSEAVQEFCTDALVIQDASNLSGVVQSFATVVRLLWDDARRLHKGTDWVNGHPIVVLFTDKLADMARRRGIEYSTAYDFCDKHRY